MTHGALHSLRALLDPAVLRALVLDLCAIPSPQGGERDAGMFVENWLMQSGFSPWRVAAVPERFHVVATIGGHATTAPHARDLLIASHLDTEGGLSIQQTRFSLPPGHPPDEKVEERDGVFYGAAVANDRGPMACFLMAADLLQRAGIRLAGRFHLAACPGEIGPDPIDEVQGVANSGKDVGAAYLLANGGIAPDFMIAAEGTDFRATAQGAGYATFRLTLLGEPVFTPLLESPADPGDHPNPIYRLGGAIARINAWARDFGKAHRFETSWGTTIPKVQIGAVRGGLPHAMGGGTGVCALYIEVGLSAVDRVQDVRREIETAMDGFGPTLLDCVAFRPGGVADPIAVQPLLDGIDRSLQATRGERLAVADPVYASMWRDHNVFNRAGIPSVTVGPRRFRPTLDDLMDATLLYALTAIEICGLETPE
jgi:formylaminopyrimidine deformylase